MATDWGGTSPTLRMHGDLGHASEKILRPDPRLTTREAEMLRFVWGYLLDQRRYPLRREIHAHFRGSGRPGPAAIVTSLLEAGVFVRMPDTTRALRITRHGVRALRRIGALPNDRLGLGQQR